MFLIWNILLSRVAVAMKDLLYRICVESEWERAETLGVYSGTEIDLRSCFIHLSSETQVFKNLTVSALSDLILLTFIP